MIINIIENKYCCFCITSLKLHHYHFIIQPQKNFFRLNTTMSRRTFWSSYYWKHTFGVFGSACLTHYSLQNGQDHPQWQFQKASLNIRSLHYVFLYAVKPICDREKCLKSANYYSWDPCYQTVQPSKTATKGGPVHSE